MGYLNVIEHKYVITLDQLDLFELKKVYYIVTKYLNNINGENK